MWQGRAVTALLGLAGALACAWLAWRLAPRRLGGAAALLAFGLCAVNAFQSYYTTVVKTYALAGLLMVLSLILFAKRPRWWALAGSGFLGMAAAATRMSAGGLLVALLPYAWLEKGRGSLRSAVWLLIGAAAGALVFFVPFLLAAPEGFLFGVLQYHTMRGAGTPQALLVFKAGFISRCVQDFFVAVMLWAALVAGRLIFGTAGEDSMEGRSAGGYGWLWAVVALVSAVHLAAPFPYDDYEVMIYPVFCAALAVGLVRFAAAHSGARELQKILRWMVLLILTAAAAGSFSSPVNQSWLILGRDRIWWRMKKESDLAKLRRVGAWVRERTHSGDEVLTQDAYIAVEARRRVPHGMEMGPFCYFEDWDTAKAERLNVLNRTLMEKILKSSPAPVAAISGYGLSIRVPEVARLSDAAQQHLWRLLRRRYREVECIRDFGQAHTTLHLLVRRDLAGDAHGD